MRDDRDLQRVEQYVNLTEIARAIGVTPRSQHDFDIETHKPISHENTSVPSPKNSQENE
jgi:cytochrome oxidase assembly protein ShyY1